MTDSDQAPETTGNQQEPESPRDGGGRFVKGVSGNPQGRPKGARHKATIAAEMLLDGQAEALTQKAIEKALEGDTAAMRLCLERMLPARKDRPVSFTLPPIDSVQDAANASGALLQAVAEGEITPSEAGEITKIIETHIRILEVSEIEQRLRKLEEATAK